MKMRSKRVEVKTATQLYTNTTSFLVPKSEYFDVKYVEEQVPTVIDCAVLPQEISTIRRMIAAAETNREKTIKQHNEHFETVLLS
jgi:hypothetical protein